MKTIVCESLLNLVSKLTFFKVYHCIHVSKPSKIEYSFIPTASDSFKVSIVDGEGYANYLEEKEFQCINRAQCRISDKSVKAGSYVINKEGIPQDFFVIVNNGNIIQRAFLDVKLSVSEHQE